METIYLYLYILIDNGVVFKSEKKPSKNDMELYLNGEIDIFEINYNDNEKSFSIKHFPLDSDGELEDIKKWTNE